MNFEFEQEQLEGYEGYKYWILKDGQKLSFQEVIELWKTSDVFNVFYNSILVNSTHPAFFWEHPPNTKLTLGTTYEFVLINSKRLNQVRQDARPFRDFLTTNDAVTTFDNLGKNAKLIVPTNIESSTNYSSLAKFVRTAPQSQTIEFWKQVGFAYEQALTTNKKWLSTSGLGVYWLHVRIDNRPKYYVCKDYKK